MPARRARCALSIAIACALASSAVGSREARAQTSSSGGASPARAGDPAAHEGVTLTPIPPGGAGAPAPTPTAHEGVTVTPLPPSAGTATTPSASSSSATVGASSSVATAGASPSGAPAAPRPPILQCAPDAPRTPSAAAAPGLAHAFGDPGSFVLVGGFSFGFAYSPQQRDHVGHALDLGAAFEVFPFRRVSFGTVLSIAFDHYLDGERTLGFGVTERVGYVVPLARHLTLWPRIGIAGLREVREGGQDPGHATAIVTTAYLPLQIEPLPHLLVGFGPEARFDLRQRLDGEDRPRGGRLGLSAEVVAWF